MLAQLYMMLAAFFLGCIVTETWWIGKMRRLRSLMEKENTSQTGASAVLAGAATAGAHGSRCEVGAEGSLLGLQQHLNEKPTQDAQATARS